MIISLFFVRCEKWTLESVDFLEINSSIVEVNINQVEIESSIEGIKTNVVTQHGHLWSSTLEEPTIQLNDGIDIKGGRDMDGNFTSQIEALGVNTVYYVRGFAETNDQVSYGNAIMITTGNVMVSTDSLIYLDANKAKIYGSLCCTELDITIDQYGFCWSSVNDSPILENDHFINLGKPTSNGVFQGTIDGLEDNTTYYYRSYAITNFGSEVVYGEVKTWDTNLKNIWKQRSDFPFPGVFFRGFSFDGKGYVMANPALLQYDPNSDDWLTKTIFPQGNLIQPVTFVIANHVYFMIGSDEENEGEPVPNNLCWRYDLVLNEWEELNPFPGVERASAVGFTLDNGKGYLGLGTNYDDNFSDFWEYDPVSDTWDEIASYPSSSAGINLFSFVIDNKGYVGGGAGSGLDNLWSYDYLSNQWTEKNTLPGGETFEVVTFVINGTAYMGTGESAGNASTKSFWSYDHNNDTWIALTDYEGLARWGGFGFSIGDKGYIGGGRTASTEYIDFWEYKVFFD